MIDVQQGEPWRRNWKSVATYVGAAAAAGIAGIATVNYVASLPSRDIVESILDLAKWYSVSGLTFLGFYIASAFLPGAPRRMPEPAAEEAAPRAPEEIAYQREPGPEIAEGEAQRPGIYRRMVSYEAPDGTRDTRTREIRIPGQPEKTSAEQTAAEQAAEREQ